MRVPSSLPGCAALLALSSLAACDALLGDEPARPSGADAEVAEFEDAGGTASDAAGSRDAGVQPGSDAGPAGADTGNSGPDAGSAADTGCPWPSYACESGCCARHLGAGGNHTCATDLAGDVYCWGEYGAAESGVTPTKVMGATKVKALAAGWGFTCAMDTNDSLACWGTNQFGELGVGDFTLDPLWTATRNSLGSALAAGGGRSHACAIDPNLDLYCWGMNDFGQLGLGGETQYQVTPQAVVWNKKAIGIAAGWKNTCAITQAGALYCWGNDTLGELGDASMVQQYAPFAVPSMQTGVTAVAVGALHACAVKDKKVFCWGDNGSKQVVTGGTGCSTSMNACYQANDVGLTGALDVVAGASHTCALLETGKVLCWGSNEYGQIGNDSADTGTFGPTEVYDLADVSQISAGLDHTCAVRKEQIWCWGSNAGGQLARATTTPLSRKPVLVTW